MKTIYNGTTEIQINKIGLVKKIKNTHGSVINDKEFFFFKYTFTVGRMTQYMIIV